MLERIGLVLITPWSSTVIRTKYELHSFVVSLLISSNYLGEGGIVVYKRQFVCWLCTHWTLFLHCVPKKVTPKFKSL